MKTPQSKNFETIGAEITKSGKNLILSVNLYIAALVISILTTLISFNSFSPTLLILSSIGLLVIFIGILVSIKDAGNSLVTAGDLISTINEIEKVNLDIEIKEEDINREFIVSPYDINSCTYTFANFSASKLTESGYSDWRLPTKEELSYIFQNKQNYTFLKNEKYWSSSEEGKDGVYVIDFTFGAENLFRKTDNFRAFFVRGKIDN